MNLYVRSWKAFRIDDVKTHLLILGDSYGDCASCRQLGMDPWKATECAGCHTKFNFIASRRSITHPGERFSIAKRILEKRPDLQFIDFDDYQKAVGNQTARDFFSS